MRLKKNALQRKKESFSIPIHPPFLHPVSWQQRAGAVSRTREPIKGPLSPSLSPPSPFVIDCLLLLFLKPEIDRKLKTSLEWIDVSIEKWVPLISAKMNHC